MEKWQIVIWALKEHFRKSEKTNWGKIQIVEELDEYEEEIIKTKALENVK